MVMLLLYLVLLLCNYCTKAAWIESTGIFLKQVSFPRTKWFAHKTSVDNAAFSMNLSADSNSFPLFTDIRNSKTKNSVTEMDSLYSYYSEVPLVFIPGMKGTHLSYLQDGDDDVSIRATNGTSSKTSRLTSNFMNNRNKMKSKSQKQRAWLSFGNLINFPPRSDDYFPRSLALPLTYHYEGNRLVQDRGHLRPDGIVENIIEYEATAAFPKGDRNMKLKLFPFYGQAMELFMNTNVTKRPNVACFEYDWRRSLEDLSLEFEEFLDNKFPGQPVQVVAHSMGGLITFGAMRRNPQKFSPGAVLVGVPFGTGIQYFQDLHRGYFTELNRCRQFLPLTQFSMSSHWSFFPTSQEEAADLFVDVTDNLNITFIPDKSGIGNPGTVFQSVSIEGKRIELDFYNVSEWERIQCGIFDPTFEVSESKKELYQNHMRIQLDKGLRWRKTVHAPREDNEILPPLVVCQSDKVPTTNQILRRERQTSQFSNRKSIVSKSKCKWEYDYISGRSVPGDGRIDFDKSFPPSNVDYSEVRLGYCLHAKQMCKQEKGGSLEKVWKEVVDQIIAFDTKIEQNISNKMDEAERNTRIRFLSKVLPFRRRGIKKIKQVSHERKGSVPLRFTRFQRRSLSSTQQVPLSNSATPSNDKNSKLRRKFWPLRVRRVRRKS